MATTVRAMLRDKAAVYSVAPDDTIFDALGLMAKHNIGAVLVLAGDEIRGICSERDYARKVALAGKTSKTTPVHEIMTTDGLRALAEGREGVTFESAGPFTRDENVAGFGRGTPFTAMLTKSVRKVSTAMASASKPTIAKTTSLCLRSISTPRESACAGNAPPGCTPA